MRSSDIDRTLISAYSNLAGLFGNEQGLSPLVPVHAPVKYSLDAVSGLTAYSDMESLKQIQIYTRKLHYL